MLNNQVSKQIDDEKTKAEHSAIILNYLKTGYLDQKDAVDKYNKFNERHPEYYYTISIIGRANGTLAPIESRDNDFIVSNLDMQLCYLTGKSLLEDLNKNNR